MCQFYNDKIQDSPESDKEQWSQKKDSIKQAIEKHGGELAANVKLSIDTAGMPKNEAKSLADLFSLLSTKP
ncbi:hypothetical protein D5018_12175 [Parashewanella curva]|uniref:Uncharacterized protein n=1 Tax=Parashewanella curva TaxID=2338552 RepID=A0A3L8PYB2_9GAMM|nr:hypothetical protein [Parashewanella curva]RLV59448.1 hypothetical protein D5018_12175 [Parashewanella curva]